MKIKFYGATWCPDCRRSKAFLDEQKIEYEYINIEEVPGAAEEVEKKITAISQYRQLSFRMARYWLSHRTKSCKRHSMQIKN